MKELLEHIAQSIVTKPDAVRIEESEEGDITRYVLHVDDEDMGRVIGKNGNVANAMRTLLRTMAVRQGKRVYLDIGDKEQAASGASEGAGETVADDANSGADEKELSAGDEVTLSDDQGPKPE